jgi:hypothetical protein
VGGVKVSVSYFKAAGDDGVEYTIRHTRSQPVDAHFENPRPAGKFGTGA